MIFAALSDPVQVAYIAATASIVAAIISGFALIKAKTVTSQMSEFLVAVAEAKAEGVKEGQAGAVSTPVPAVTEARVIEILEARDKAGAQHPMTRADVVDLLNLRDKNNP